MVIDKLQKRFGNMCRNCFVERWVEPNNIAFSISGWLLLYWLLVFLVCEVIPAVSGYSYSTFACSKMVSFDEFFDSRLFIDVGSCLRMSTG